MICPECQAVNPTTSKVCGESSTQLSSPKDVEVTETMDAPKEELARDTTFAERYKILLVLLFFLLGFTNSAFTKDDAEIYLIHEFASRYILYGVDFLPDNHSINIFGLGIAKEKFFAFPYMAVGKDYLEWGCSIDYTLTIENLNFKTILFPLVWKFTGEEGTDWGVLVGEEMSIQTLLNPRIGYLYVWFPDFPEWTGHYFFLGFSKNVFSVDFKADFAYNNGFITEAEGFCGLIEVSRVIALTDWLFVTPFFRYYWNDPDINENEKVFGISTSIKVF